MAGTLYICPTPIGNLGDMTFRTIDTLKKVDLIAAEDTRHSIKLLNHFEIKKPMTSYHKYNIAQKSDYLINKLNEGLDIALISDAGMPGISDPGEELIRLAVEEGINVVVLPGPSAFLLALVKSGLPTNRFCFEGFLPSKSNERKKKLLEIKEEERTIVFYEAPHRIVELLEDMLEVFGDRLISVSRELTKMYEETLRGTISEILEEIKKRALKGEIVVVVEGYKRIESEIDIKAELEKLRAKGISNKKAVEMVAKEFNLPKNKVYKESLEK
jgi:16S rRNA (cytidine1402-2'-O)-methyltransferase